jgi:hypothetical protein
VHSTRIVPSPACRTLRIHILLLVLTSCALLVSESKAKETTIKKTEFGTGVQTGVYLTTYHDSCIYFRLFFVSENFFSNLKAKDTPTGKVFKKGPDEYRTFPDKLILDVEATVIPCSDPPDTRIILDKSIGFLGSLSFETNWKLSDSELPVTAVVPLKVEHPTHGIRWDYLLEISAKEIPLTAELCVRISARDNIHLPPVLAHLK